MATTPWHWAQHTTLEQLWKILEADIEAYKAQVGEPLTGMEADIKPDPITNGYWWRWRIPAALVQRLRQSRAARVAP